MTKVTIAFFFLASSFAVFGQSIDEPFSIEKMEKDLEVFKEIRQKANSGLYKYHTKQQIDSLYEWAGNEIQNITTYIGFYNLISTLTDFEGSLHNNTSLPQKYLKSILSEEGGYFPYPLKWIEGRWLVNYKDGDLPLGAEITAINDVPISEVIVNLHKYYTTDGVNTTGKRIGISSAFSRYYRYHYGLKDTFEISFIAPNSDIEETLRTTSVRYSDYRVKFRKRHSRPFDKLQFKTIQEKERYAYKQIDEHTGLLTLNTFGMGNEESEEHLEYKAWLDSIFIAIKKSELENLIVDVRNNGGGDDPNDVVTYSYLTNRTFQESKQAWISFNKVPLLKYYDSPFPRILRPLGVGKFNRDFQKRFPREEDGRFYISKVSNEMKIRQPNDNAFKGNIYLLISPRVASAGSLFAALVAGNDNTTSIGEETMGGYYGHNGHTPFGYVLPRSKIVTEFSIDNIAQDVPVKANQFYNRGVIPDYEVLQTFEDFLDNKDTQMEFVLNLIREK
jgi:hypothetical protein